MNVDHSIRLFCSITEQKHSGSSNVVKKGDFNSIENIVWCVQVHTMIVFALLVFFREGYYFHNITSLFLILLIPGICPYSSSLPLAAAAATEEQCGVNFFALEHLAGSSVCSVHSSTFYYTAASPTYYLYH